MRTPCGHFAVRAVILVGAGLMSASASAQLKVMAYNCYHRPGAPGDAAWTTMLGNVANSAWHNSYYGPGVNPTIPRRPAILALTEVGTTLQPGDPPSGQYVQEICNTLWAGEGANYARVQIHAGSYEDYCFIYDTSQVDLLEELTVAAGYRPAHRGRFRPVGYTSVDSDFYIYNVHLKAYPGEEGTRAGEITAILLQSVPGRARDLPPTANIMFVGDFNFTTWPSEPGYDRLLDPAWALDAVCTDPVGDVISQNWPQWGRYGSAAPAPFNSYSSGGPWSRIDFIFPSTDLTDGGGLDIIPGTIHVHGNQNGSTRQYGIISSVSDHLGVIADLQLPARMGVSVVTAPVVIAGAAITVNVENTAPAIVTQGADELVYAISGTGVVTGSANGVALALGGPQSHQVALSSAAFGPSNGTVNVTSSSPSVQNGAFSQNVSVTVFAHSQASFSSAEDIDATTIDFGSFAPGSIDVVETYDIFNLLTSPSWTAPLSIKGASGVGSTSALSTSVPLTTVPGGAAATFAARLQTSGQQRGVITSTWTIQVADPSLPGAQSGPDLALTLRAYVAVDGDANLDRKVDDADFSVLLAHWGDGDTFAEGDFNGDGTVDDADFSLMLNNWGYLGT